MHTTTAQNQAHRNDIVWQRTGKAVKHDGQNYLAEYTNVFTGEAIRKDWRMTGQDWVIFTADGSKVGRAHSLTQAKFDAANPA